MGGRVRRDCRIGGRLMSRSTGNLKEEYRQYTLGLALFDIVPVFLFLISCILIYSMCMSRLFLAGALCCFIGGMAKVIWKLIVVLAKRDIPAFSQAFRVLMICGFALMLLSVILSTVRSVAGGGAFADSAMAGLWRGLTFMPAMLFFIAGFAGMCMMGWLGSHMDKSARSNWIEELINTAAQLAILAGVVIVYFGMSYQPGDTAAAALEDTGSVKVTETEEYILFDGAGTEDALVFYPGGKVEAAAYAPLMMKIAENGTDCFLCSMPLNFALLDSDAAEDIREGYGSSYTHWYAGGHSLGGVAASMLTAGGTDWDGLILLASYPADEQRIPVLSVYGSEDKVLDFESYSRAYDKGRFPEDTAEQVMRGGNHAGFGSYGAQKGDGAAKISSEEQQTEAAGIISSFVR